MSTVTVKITKDPYGNHYSIFKKPEAELKSGVTILVGCNGYGKTTFIRELEDWLKFQKIKYIKYNNLTDGGSTSISKMFYLNNTDRAVSMVLSSEGENIYENFGDVLYNIGTTASKLKRGQKLFILCDAVDSGLSIDNILEVKGIFDLVVNNEKKAHGIDVYMIFSANSFELAREQNCFDVYECKYITFDDYEEYKKYVLNTKKLKEKRLKRAENIMKKKKDKMKNG